MKASRTHGKLRLKKAGHRSWAAANARVPGSHRGDTMSVATRSQVMSRIRGKNTGPERALFGALRERGITFARHVAKLPGRPDVVLHRSKLAVFVDGDFWHGWRFSLWEHKLSEAWRKKIAKTRARDQQNFRQLRRRGWTVVRLWEHQIVRNAGACVDRVIDARDASGHSTL
jgi:DNA mismatch endonuclease (patch repair protein)